MAFHYIVSLRCRLRCRYKTACKIRRGRPRKQTRPRPSFIGAELSVLTTSCRQCPRRPTILLFLKPTLRGRVRSYANDGQGRIHDKDKRQRSESSMYFNCKIAFVLGAFGHHRFASSRRPTLHRKQTSVRVGFFCVRGNVVQIIRDRAALPQNDGSYHFPTAVPHRRRFVASEQPGNSSRFAVKVQSVVFR